MIKYIIDDNLYLREVKRIDALDFYEIGKNQEVVYYLNWGPYKKLSDAVFAIKNHFLKKIDKTLPKSLAIISKDLNKCLGWIEFYNDIQMNNGVELGFVLNKDYQNQGIMSKCLQKVLDLCYNLYNYDVVICLVVEDNICAKHLVEKFNFSIIDSQNYFHHNGYAQIRSKLLYYILRKGVYSEYHQS
jgi:ribosomal-protein-alanine N-acetyltransferase